MKNDLPIKRCKNCGEEFRRKRLDQVFCQAECRQAYHRRNEVRGGRAVELLIEWRTTRGGKKGILGEIARIVDGWIRQDKEAKK